MGEDYRAWHRQLKLNLQLPNQNSSDGAHLHFGLSAYSKPGTNISPMNGSLPAFEAPNSIGGQASEPHRWFYCLPRFRQALMPSVAATPTESSPFPAFCNKSRGETMKPNVEYGRQKKFLVVDQSADQTTLIFSSGVGDPVHCLASWKRNNPNGGPSMEIAGSERAAGNLSKPIVTGPESEMHEDTEELDALLYSDDGYSTGNEEDDEVTSTGHSPSTMTSFDMREDVDEVASSGGTAEKSKPFLADTASSVKRKRSLELKDDAESSCVDESGSRELGNKRVRKEKIRETVSVLQKLIPNGEGKDVVVVLDEAIEYLKSLKLKAQVFGFDALL